MKQAALDRPRMRQRNVMRLWGVSLAAAALVGGCGDVDSVEDRTQALQPAHVACDAGTGDSGAVCTDTGSPVCGDMRVTPSAGEECEPPGTPSCDSTCRRTLRECGNQVLDEGEECDDGNALSGDSCSDRCLGEACGNGRVDASEQCEPPNTAACDAACKVMARALQCGNGALDPEEECEVSTAAASDRCNDSCQTEACGNARIDSTETCEPPGTATCDASCKVRVATPPPTVVCGDAIRQLPEECDDGNTDNTDLCSRTCLAKVCGNGRLDIDETCEPPNARDCSPTCERLFCGDNIITAALGEECDDRFLNAGQPVSGDGCSATCLIEECGNGRIDPGEECELPNTSTCNADCEGIGPPVCGDGTAQAPEECDDGNLLSGDKCDSTCKNEVCGNRRVEPPEQCDPPGTQTCDALCKQRVPLCGNSFIDPLEQCDDGNRTPGDGCNATCQAEVCANGTVDFPGECEPPSTTTCNQACRPIIPVCGDGKIEGREQCEGPERPPVSGDGCSALCLAEICGNGTLDQGEQCEPPGVNRCNASCRLIP